MQVTIHFRQPVTQRYANGFTGFLPGTPKRQFKLSLMAEENQRFQAECEKRGIPWARDEGDDLIESMTVNVGNLDDALKFLQHFGGSQFQYVEKMELERGGP